MQASKKVSFLFQFQLFPRLKFKEWFSLHPQCKPEVLIRQMQLYSEGYIIIQMQLYSEGYVIIQMQLYSEGYIIIQMQLYSEGYIIIQSPSQRLQYTSIKVLPFTQASHFRISRNVLKDKMKSCNTGTYVYMAR